MSVFSRRRSTPSVNWRTGSPISRSSTPDSLFSISSENNCQSDQIDKRPEFRTAYKLFRADKIIQNQKSHKNLSRMQIEYKIEKQWKNLSKKRRQIFKNRSDEQRRNWLRHIFEESDDESLSDIEKI